MSSIAWYWHRLRAMNAGEIVGRFEKKAKQFVDRRREFDPARSDPGSPEPFPKLPERGRASDELRSALKKNAEAILRGEWMAFAEVKLQVDDHPHWQKDYLAQKQLFTRKSAFSLDHRRLPDGADIKVIWELSRWNPLVRLAQWAWLTGDEAARSKCLDWLKDWVEKNPPYHGWNWTSPLEAAMRLIQFTWIDALLSESVQESAGLSKLQELRKEILRPHVEFTWRYRSLGSSANNHLLGELSGLIVSQARWPGLGKWASGLDNLKGLWEREVLAQFAEDGGNREQALNYHLFSFEFAWQARLALQSAGMAVSQRLEERLVAAAEFFEDVQVEGDRWDYGDSDSAFVTPFFITEEDAPEEWRKWMQGSETNTGIHFWLEAMPKKRRGPQRFVEDSGWRVYPDSGIGILRKNDWVLRFDFSPLGYLSTAAHGNLDALHLSVWFQGVAFAIDPGTGAYYGDPKLRAALAGWQAHNGPRINEEELAKRLGPFLWGDHHAPPKWVANEEGALTGMLSLGSRELRRSIRHSESEEGWIMQDNSSEAGDVIEVSWQFPADAVVGQEDARLLRIQRREATIWLHIRRGELRGIERAPCSRSFRRVEQGPRIDLRGEGHNPCFLETAFLRSNPL